MQESVSIATRKAIMKLLSIPHAFLLLMVTAIVLLATGDPRLASSARAQVKPNIIFVLTDDQAPGTEAETYMPALNNNIINGGVEFTNMTSTYPLCCPGRATILRGQYPHNTKIFGNSLPQGGWAKFDQRGEENSTMATWLNNAGYQTGLFGKYMNNYTSLEIPPGWDRWHAWNGPLQGWTYVNDQGTRKELIRNAADRDTSSSALRYLGNHLDKPAPVFAWVSFGAEHEPYYHDDADDGAFTDVGVPRTPAFNEDDVSDKPSHIQSLPQFTDAEVADMDEDYRDGLRSLMRVDRFIGQASAMLRNKQEMANTYFVFYTDNGNHFGQHRLEHGKLQPYREDTNFPLIVRGPGIDPGLTQDGTNGKLVGSHDIAPTLARMGGAGVPGFVDGRSFLGLAKNPSTPWGRTAILSERETGGSTTTQRWDMLRMPDKTYTRYGTGEKEYYNLTLDPDQVHNAFSTSKTDPPRYAAPDSATRDHYEKRLNDLYTCKGHDGDADSCTVAENAPLRPTGTAP
jgi:N-acetylglucosamine-6-sulfatase